MVLFWPSCLSRYLDYNYFRTSDQQSLKLSKPVWLPHAHCLMNVQLTVLRFLSSLIFPSFIISVPLFVQLVEYRTERITVFQECIHLSFQESCTPFVKCFVRLSFGSDTWLVQFSCTVQSTLLGSYWASLVIYTPDKSHYSVNIGRFSKGNQVIDSSFPISIPSSKVITKTPSEISCWLDSIMSVEKGAWLWNYKSDGKTRIHSFSILIPHIQFRGWYGGAKVSCIVRHRGVQLILAYSWTGPATL